MVLAACGSSSIPGNAIVRIGNTSITKTTFNHWMSIAALSSQTQTGATAPTAATTVPVPPDYTACIAAKKKTAAKPAKGQPAPTDAQYKIQCQQQYDGLRQQVEPFLISAAWLLGEANDQKVTVTDAEVAKEFNTTKQQSFPKAADFTKFLKSSGETVQDLLFRVKLNQISTKLRTKITKGKSTVTAAQIAAYYNKNKARFAQPERRDLRIILTKTQAQAQAALNKIKGGASFAKIAKADSIDQASKNQGGVLLAVAKGQQEKALDTAVFAAKKGVLTGPVKTQFGYYVFKVQKITAASQQPLAQATPTIKQLLQQQSQQNALNKFVSGFRKKWTKKTTCRSGYLTADCHNNKKSATATTATPTAATPAQTAAPQTAAPQTVTVPSSTSGSTSGK